MLIKRSLVSIYPSVLHNVFCFSCCSIHWQTLIATKRILQFYLITFSLLQTNMLHLHFCLSELTWCKRKTRTDTLSFIWWLSFISRSALCPAEAPGHQLPPPVFSGRLDVWGGGDWHHGPAEEDDGSCWELPIHAEAAAPRWVGGPSSWGHDVEGDSLNRSREAAAQCTTVATSTCAKIFNPIFTFVDRKVQIHCLHFVHIPGIEPE